MINRDQSNGTLYNLDQFVYMSIWTQHTGYFKNFLYI